MMYVLNLTFPKDVSDVMQNLALGSASCPIGTLSEMGEGGDIGMWSAPKQARVGDICVIMCAKTARANMRRFVDTMCSRGHARELRSVMDAAQCDVFEHDAIIIDAYAGMVAGWARLLADACLDASATGHWENRVYARMGDWHPMEPGTSLLGMEPLITINRFGGITMLSDDAAEVVARMCGIMA